MIYTHMTETEMVSISLSKNSYFLLNLGRREGIRNAQCLKEKTEATGYFAIVYMH